MSISTQITVVATAEQIIVTAPGALRGPQGLPGPMGDVTPEVTQLAEAAQAAAESAATSKDGAQQNAGLSEEFKAEAEASAAVSSAQAELAENQASIATSAAESSALASEQAQFSAGIVKNTADGIATGKKYFSVVSPDSADVLMLYENVSGVAVDTGKRTPSASAVADIAGRLESTSTIGLSTTPINGSYYSPNTRVFANPVAETGAIRKIRIFSGAGAHTLRVRRFSSSGSGPLAVGNVLTRVGADQVVTFTGAGAQELAVDIPVNKGEFIGFYDSALSYTYAPSPSIAAFATAAAPGDYTSFTVGSIPTGFALQIGFDVVSDYVDANRIKTIEAEVSQLTTVSDAVAGIPDRLSATSKVGLPGAPSAGTYLSPNTRVFADRIAVDGTLRKVRTYSGAGNHTLTIRRFTAPGSDQLKVGDVLTQIGSDVTIAYSGESAKEIDINISVNAGEIIGVYGSASSYAAISNGLGPAYATASTAGNYATFTVGSTSKSYSFQLGFDLVFDYVDTPRVQTIESGLSQLQTSANIVVEDISQLPKVAAGVQGVVTGNPMGAVWYDGFIWRWTRDNSIVPNPGMLLLDLARQDGWMSLYDVSNKAALTTLTSGGAQYISGIKDGLNGSPDALQTVVGKYPELSPAGLGGKASAKFSGVEHLSVAGTRRLSQPYFLLSVADFTGPMDVVGSTGKFLFDGLSPDRAAIIGDDIPGGNIKGWATRSIEGSRLNSAPVVFGVQFNGDHSESWVNGWSYSIDSTPITNGLTLGKIGADWQGSRNWIGNLAALLVYEGIPSQARLGRMQELLFDLYGITKPPISLTAQGASLVRLSDMQVMYEKNPSAIIQVASVTKAMTALVLDRWVSDLSQTVTVDTSDIIFESQTTFVQAGDVISYLDLMYSALLPSDNNAATTISRCVGQLINPSAATPGAAKSAFVAEMNAVAALLGMTSTTYSNAYEGCLTTATDLPKLLENINTSAPRVMSVGGATSRQVVVTGVNPRTISIDHTINANAVPGFLFGKTGSGLGFGSVIVICEQDGIKYAASILRADPVARLREVRWMLAETVG